MKKKIAIIGSGVVGQATGRGLLAWGHEVEFYDNSLIALEMVQKKDLNTCGIESCLLNQEIYMVSVSTPTVDDRIYLGNLKAAMATLGNVLRQNIGYSVVVIRSTVPPGTTEKMLIPILEEFSGKKAGYDFGVAMNPEYLREASAEEDFAHPRTVVVGFMDSRTRDVMDEVYASVKVEKNFVPIRVAEMQKYTHNYLNALKISFGNEIRTLCETLEIDADLVLKLTMQTAEASWNPNYGIRNFGPFGGSCLPKDTQALFSWARDELYKTMHLLGATIRVNDLAKEK
jgi:UDPglucose 6-dehydrogenase